MKTLQNYIDEESSRLKSKNLSAVYRFLGRGIGEDLAGEIVIAEVGVYHTPIISLADGIGRERTHIIGINPQPAHNFGIEYRQGLAQQLPLYRFEVDVLLYDDSLRFILSTDSRVESFDPKCFHDSNETVVREVCSEILKIMPNHVIFRDPTPHPIYKKYSNTPEEWHKLILENLKPKYTSIDFEKIMKELYRGKPLDSWLILSKNFTH